MTAAPPSARERVLWSALPAAVVLLAGIALRVRLLASPVGRLDSDEAIVALMGARIHHGAHPLFFWGQYYGGTVEVAFVSIAQLVRRGVLAVKVVPLLLSLVAAWLTMRAARHVVDDRRALLAGALVAGWPGTVWLATKERGFYWCTLVLVLGAVVVALRIRDDEHVRRLDALLLGLLAGLAWYESAQSAFVVVPLLAWLVVAVAGSSRGRDATSEASGGDGSESSVPIARRVASLVWPIAAGAVVGALPWIWGIVRHGTLVFREPGPRSAYAERLSAVVRETIPRALGLRGTYYGGALLGPLGVIVTAAAVVAAGIALVRTLRAGPAARWAPFAWIVVAFPLIAAVPKATAFSFEPRYGLLIVPVAAIALAACARTRTATVVVVVIVVAFAAANTHYALGFSEQHPTGLDLTPPDVRPLRGLLAAIGTNRLYADYWLAYPLTEASHETVVASPLDAPRSAYHESIVNLSRARLWVVFAGSRRDHGLPAVLRAHGVGFRRSAGRGLAFYVLDRWYDPGRLSAFWSSTPAGYG